MAKTLFFPDEASETRLRRYGVYERLLEGSHFTAYSPDEEFLKRFQYLRFISCNFAGLISKVLADVLFGEKVDISSKDDKQQEFIDSLIVENSLITQFYESSLFNSARGDAVLRARVADNQIIIEDINPAIYFPDLDRNFRQEPDREVLAWKEYHDDKIYLLKEIHTSGLIEMEAYQMKSKDDKEIVRKVPIKEYNKLFGTDYKEKEDTGIESIPIVHIPNFRAKYEFWGTSDYHDLESLFMSVNNRMTSIDNILDKHGDPILAVPEGVLEEDGSVRKEKLGMIEVREGEGKPEYIVWNANLESAFREIDELVKMIFLIGEISPDVVGIDSGKGAVESGRALKLRMVRTLAKKNRKSLYYEQGIKKIVGIASEFANAGYKAGNIAYKGDIIDPSVVFSDGVVDDKVEEISNETIKLEAGLTSQKKAIKEVQDLDDHDADALIKDIQKDKDSRADINSERLFVKQRQDINDQQTNR
jgi:hypothetical protein